MSTMLVMAKKKTGGRPKKIPTEPIQIRVPKPMAEALEQLAARNYRERTVELVLILEEKLRSLGIWPPPDEDE